MKLIVHTFIIFLLYQICSIAAKKCWKAKYENGSSSEFIYEVELCNSESSDCFTATYSIANNSFDVIIAGCKDGYMYSMLYPYEGAAYSNITSCKEDLCNKAIVDYILAAITIVIDYPDTNLCTVPSCDGLELAQGTLSCVGTLVNGYLIGGTNNCKKGWDKAVDCLAKLGTKCLDGRCLPDSSLKYILQLITDILSGIKDQSTLSDALKVYIGFDTKPIFEPIVCSNNITKIMEAVFTFQSQFAKSNLTNLFTMFGIQLNPCTQSLFKLRNLLMEVTPRLAVLPPAEIFNQLMIFIPNVIKTIQPCGDGIIFETILYYFDEFNNFGGGLFQNVMKMLIGSISSDSRPTTVTDLNSKPFECPTPDRHGRVDLNCSRFYHKSSKCDLRRAWFCDYINWRVNMLEIILKDFDEKIFASRGFVLPDCYDEDEISCRLSQKCCYNSYNGCKVCFCNDQDYINEYHLERLWKNDSQIWTNFVNHYYKVYSEGPHIPKEDPSTC